MSEQDDLDAELLAQMRDDFLTESNEILDRLGPLLTSLEKGGSQEVINNVFREVHTLKGTAGFVGLESIRQLAHRLEDLFGAVRAGTLAVTPELVDVSFAGIEALQLMRQQVLQGRPDADPSPVTERVAAAMHGVQLPSTAGPPATVPAPPPPPPLEAAPPPVAEPPPVPPIVITLPIAPPAPLAPAVAPPPAAPVRAAEPHAARETLRTEAESTLRVDVATLDTLMLQVGELITARNALVANAERIRDEALLENAAALSRVIRQLQSTVTTVRLVPVDRLFTRFTGVVRNLARECGKLVGLQIEGGNTPLDRAVSEQMYDPLIHLLRNAIDHGLEPAVERRQLGKPAEGTIRLEAVRRGEHVLLRVSDDGRGIDPERVRAAAVRRGMYTPEQAAALPADQVLRLVFAPGFSTATSVTDMSGRGVGMDVVLQNVRRLGGNIEIETELGQGTTFVIQLPLTLAILQVLLARVDGYTYALPLHTVRETLRLGADALQTMQGREVVFVRDVARPVRRLRTLLRHIDGAADHRGGHAIVVQRGGVEEVLFVDELVGKQQIVIKPLSAYLGTVPGVEGAGILPDGSVTLILDLDELGQASA